MNLTLREGVVFFCCGRSLVISENKPSPKTSWNDTMLPPFKTAAAICLALSVTASTQAQTFRLGNQPYRFVEDAPGTAYTRQTPTLNAYFRPTPTGDDQIGPLADQLDQHLKMSYRHDLPEYNRRYVHFRAAMDAFDQSPKGIEEQGQMTQWLKTSIHYSMPGSHDFLPPLPIVNPVDLDSGSTRASSSLDPFGDDPLEPNVETAPR
jgi:hypothetical protein